MEEIDIEAKRNSGIVNFENRFNLPLINVLWALVGGERFKHDDIKLNRLVAIVRAFVSNIQASRLALPMPAFLLKWPVFCKMFIGAPMDIFQAVQGFIRASYSLLKKLIL